MSDRWIARHTTADTIHGFLDELSDGWWLVKTLTAVLSKPAPAPGSVFETDAVEVSEGEVSVEGLDNLSSIQQARLFVVALRAGCPALGGRIMHRIDTDDWDVLFEAAAREVLLRVEKLDDEPLKKLDWAPLCFLVLSLHDNMTEAWIERLGLDPNDCSRIEQSLVRTARETTIEQSGEVEALPDDHSTPDDCSPDAFDGIIQPDDIYGPNDLLQAPGGFESIEVPPGLRRQRIIKANEKRRTNLTNYIETVQSALADSKATPPEQVMLTLVGFGPGYIACCPPVTAPDGDVGTFRHNMSDPGEINDLKRKKVGYYHFKLYAHKDTYRLKYRARAVFGPDASDRLSERHPNRLDAIMGAIAATDYKFFRDLFGVVRCAGDST